ncbi:biotin--protein ligase-like protein [Dinothrombium tinctorium]|uniref:Biotin--protein ligase-like protein n=1 Tax=Dinothrombium tinctorium TaxID=1965070 RepID=A0A3S3P3I6_9ACAR|nr:biotin--protein ligase-like protein [Dinothrombium tinctorium]RWS11287.1 biotin--protein ligase-like protein [Dinothrombium tinctorium]RWS11314.1 biotin--protein ligase-like protein [Dinothrombium tinctorium]
MSMVKGLPTALKDKRGESGQNHASAAQSGNKNNGLKRSEKPLNILVAIDDEILDEQQKLEQEQPYIANTIGGVHRKLSSTRPPSTLWITNSSTIFKSIKKLLLKIIGCERFTIYPITQEEIKTKPWQHTTALFIFIINSRKYKEEDEFLISVDKVVKEYISSDGLFVIYKLDELWENGDYIIGGEDGLKTNVFKQKLISKCGKKFLTGSSYTRNVEGRVIKFEDDDIDVVVPKLSVAHLITPDEDLIDDKFIRKVNDSKSPVYIAKNKEMITEPITRIPILVHSDINSVPPLFDFETYYANLASSRLGHHIIFSEVTTSSMNLVEPFTQFDGLVAVANQQIEGKGRGENQWITPKGGLAFTLHFQVSLASNLGQRLGFVQHLASLSIIKSVLNIPEYSHLELKLKWPNDIYWGEHSKIGGVIVTSRLEGNNVHCFIGCGLNVSNPSPTECIHSIIKQSIDPKSGEIPNLPLLSKEEILARSLNQLEVFLKKFEREGVQSFKNEYLRHWLHSGKCVRMANTKEVIIEGLDDQGYLLVKDVASGLLLSVHPDGNRFDMLNNLLVRKV